MFSLQVMKHKFTASAFAQSYVPRRDPTLLMPTGKQLCLVLSIINAKETI